MVGVDQDINPLTAALLFLGVKPRADLWVIKANRKCSEELEFTVTPFESAHHHSQEIYEMIFFPGDIQQGVVGWAE